MYTKIDAGKFIDACMRYDETEIISMMKQGYDVCDMYGEYEDFLYSSVLEEFLSAQLPIDDEENSSTDIDWSLLPKLTRLFCENGANFAKLDKYVNDGDHPTPFWMLAFLEFDDIFRETVEVLIEYGMTVNEYEEIIDHITTDLCFCYGDGYGLPNTAEFDKNLQAIMWFTSFPQMFEKAEWYKQYIGYREGFDYTQFRNVHAFTYKTENFDTSTPYGPVNAKVEVFDKLQNKVYEFTLG